MANPIFLFFVIVLNISFVKCTTNLSLSAKSDSVFSFLGYENTLKKLGNFNTLITRKKWRQIRKNVKEACPPTRYSIFFFFLLLPYLILFIIYFTLFPRSFTLLPSPAHTHTQRTHTQRRGPAARVFTNRVFL